MAQIIDTNLKVQLGQLIRVRNLNQKVNQNDIYVAVQIQDQDGDNQRCVLFTEVQIADMEKIYAQFLSKMVYGRIYNFIIGNRKTNIIRVKNYNKEDKFLRISASQLKRAQKRAQNNKEDLTKKSFFTDLTD